MKMVLSEKKHKPVFFVVGAAKSGTSSLYHYLESHKDIHMCPHKDVACYFCRHYGMPVTFEEYVSMLLPVGDYKIAGDGCHSYLTDTKSAEWISSKFPRAKIIIILRNPVDKIYSQYNWLVNNGFEHIETFEKALQIEDDRYDRNVWKVHGLTQGYKPNYLYYRSALYSKQVEEYLKFFHREQVLFLKFDDLKKDSTALMESVYEFLEVNHNPEPDLKIYNKRKSVLSVRFQFYCANRLTKVLPRKIIKLLMAMNSSSRKHMTMSAETRAKLVERYHDDIDKTELLTGLSLNDWKI